MKKWTIILTAAVLVLAMAIGIGSYYLPVWTADCIVRVSYTGFAGIFHEPYEYYAVCGDNAVRVAPWVLEQMAPEAISGSKYQDTETTQWFTSLNYWKRYGVDQFLDETGPWLPTKFGEKHRIYYQNWGGPKIDAGADVQAVMLQAAYYFHDGNPEHWSSAGSNGERGLTWFIVVSDGEHILVQHQEDALYRPLEDGTFQLLMECPRDGQFDYFWIP